MTPPVKNPAARKKRSSATEAHLRSRYTLRGWNLTAHQAMGWSFTIQTHWPDDGTQALEIAWHYFRQLGLLETATARLLTRIYECLKRYTATELREAIDAKHASLGETHEARLAKVQFISKPDNFFNPHDAALMKWVSKSPAFQKRRQAEARAASAAKAPAAAAEREQRDRAAARAHDELAASRRRDQLAHERKSHAWREWLWPMLTADEQNAALMLGAKAVEEERKRIDFSTEELGRRLRAATRGYGSSQLMLKHPPRYAELRREFEAEYTDPQISADQSREASASGGMA